MQKIIEVGSSLLKLFRVKLVKKNVETSCMYVDCGGVCRQQGSRVARKPWAASRRAWRPQSDRELCTLESCSAKHVSVSIGRRHRQDMDSGAVLHRK